MLWGKNDSEGREILEQWRQAIVTGEMYGYGLSRRLYVLNQMPSNFVLNLKGIYDSNTSLQGQTVLGYKMLAPAQAGVNSGKIIVFPSDFSNICEYLTGLGLREGYDFISADDFWPVMAYFKYDQLLYPGILSVFVTSRCTLRCRDCGVRIPYWPNLKDRLETELQADIDGFFQRVDKIRQFGITGGEPLLADNLPSFLDYVGTAYRHRIGLLTINTNGTVTPSAQLLEVCRRHDVLLQFSDYRAAGIKGYAAKYEQAVKAAVAYGLSPMQSPGEVTWRSPLATGEMRSRLESYDEREMSHHFSLCRPACMVLESGRFYHCHRALDNEKITGINDAGAVNFHDVSRFDLLKCFLGENRRGYLDFCRQCPGKTFNAEVPAAEQL